MGELLRDEAAELAGVRPNTFSGYVARGQAPKPARHVGKTPLWDEQEIKDWMGSRPGIGSRSTDRARRRAEQRAAERSTDAGTDQGSSSDEA